MRQWHGPELVRVLLTHADSHAHVHISGLLLMFAHLYSMFVPECHDSDTHTHTPSPSLPLSLHFAFLPSGIRWHSLKWRRGSMRWRCVRWSRRWKRCLKWKFRKSSRNSRTLKLMWVSLYKHMCVVCVIDWLFEYLLEITGQLHSLLRPNYAYWIQITSLFCILKIITRFHGCKVSVKQLILLAGSQVMRPHHLVCHSDVAVVWHPSLSCTKLRSGHCSSTPKGFEIELDKVSSFVWCVWTWVSRLHSGRKARLSHSGSDAGDGRFI